MAPLSGPPQPHGGPPPRPTSARRRMQHWRGPSGRWQGRARRRYCCSRSSHPPYWQTTTRRRRAARGDEDTRAPSRNAGSRPRDAKSRKTSTADEHDSRPSKPGTENARSASRRDPEPGRVGPRRRPEDRWRARRRGSAPSRRAAPHATAPAVDHVDAIVARARDGVTRRRSDRTQGNRGTDGNQRGQPKRQAAAAGAQGPPPS